MFVYQPWAINVAKVLKTTLLLNEKHKYFYSISIANIAM